MVIYKFSSAENKFWKGSAGNVLIQLVSCPKAKDEFVPLDRFVQPGDLPTGSMFNVG